MCNHNVMIITDSAFVGGVGVTTNGLMQVADLFGDSYDTKKILVTLSDGEEYMEELCVRDLALLLRDNGVEMYAVGKLLYDALS